MGHIMTGPRGLMTAPLGEKYVLPYPSKEDGFAPLSGEIQVVTKLLLSQAPEWGAVVHRWDVFWGER
jgi:hypothetical protein